MKRILLSLALLVGASCGSHSESKRGALNLGSQPAAITLVSGVNLDVKLASGHASPGTLLRVTPAAGGSSIGGVDSTAVADGDTYFIRNESTTDNVTLLNVYSSETIAANKLALPSGGDAVLPPRGSTWIEWDSTAGSWEAGPGLITIASTVPQETVTSGALSTSKKTLLSVTGTQAYTLADCTAIGQRKLIEVTVAGSTPLGTLTLTTTFNSEPTTHVFTAVGEKLELECMSGLAWHVAGKTRAGTFTVVVGTTVLTGYDMQATYALSVTGTVSSTTTKAIPNCYVPGERIHVSTPTAASTPSGSITINGLTVATGVAATTLGGVNATSAQADFVCDGANWQNLSVTTATYSMLDSVIETFREMV